MYGIDGERRLTEFEAPWLPGYDESRPVRIGNAASEQFQLDVYGEVIQALYEARRLGVPEAPRRALAGAQADRVPRDGVAEARRRHLGGARRSPPLRPLEDDGVGRRSTG